jgi:hypothetical protein
MESNQEAYSFNGLYHSKQNNPCRTHFLKGLFGMVQEHKGADKSLVK